MPQVEYLPGFETARAEDVRLVYTPGAQVPADPERRTSLAGRINRELERKQICAGSLGRLATPGDIYDGEPPDSWEELVARTAAWTSSHIDTLDVRDLAAYAVTTDFPSVETTIEHVKTVAREAAVTTAAYLEVTPKVLMDEEFEDPNAEIAAYGGRGMGFVLAWSGLHTQVDESLAFALSVSPPPQEQVFSGVLHFNPKWFMDAQGHIVLDPGRVPDLRDGTHHRHPSQNNRGEMRLFGCPGRHMIPVIYRAMLRGATDGELFAATYHGERGNHGYTEYHGQAGAEEAERLDPVLAL